MKRVNSYDSNDCKGRTSFYFLLHKKQNMLLLNNKMFILLKKDYIPNLS